MIMERTTGGHMDKRKTLSHGVISVRDISSVLDIGKNQAYELVQAAYLHTDKFFPVFKIGNNYKIPKQPFYRWLNNSNFYNDL